MLKASQHWHGGVACHGGWPPLAISQPFGAWGALSNVFLTVYRLVGHLAPHDFSRRAVPESGVIFSRGTVPYQYRTVPYQYRTVPYRTVTSRNRQHCPYGMGVAATADETNNGYVLSVVHKF